MSALGSASRALATGVDAARARLAALERGEGPGAPADLPIPAESGKAWSEDQIRDLRRLLDAAASARRDDADGRAARSLIERLAPGAGRAATDSAVPLLLAYRADIDALYGEDPRTAEALAAFRERVDGRRARLAADLARILPKDAADRIADSLPPSKPLSTTDKKAPTDGR